MSDYFGALIRSSGMAIGPGVSASAPERLPASAAVPDLGLVELDVQRDAPPPAPPMLPPAVPPTPPVLPPAVPPTPPVQTHAVSEAPPAGARQKSEALPPERVAAEVPAVAAVEATVTPPARPAAPEHPGPARWPLTPSGAVAPALSGHSDLGQAMVRAVIQWVAAVPPRPMASPAGLPRPRPTPPMLAMDTSTHQMGWPADPPESVAEICPAPRAGAPPPPSIVTPIRVAPIQPVESIERAAVRATANDPAASEEVVEVSIGAIHVRVDAPAVQTVAPPSALAAATRPLTDRAPDRSGLARRALRRI